MVLIRVKLLLALVICQQNLRDPKTGQSYNFRTGTIGGKPVAVVSATYERIYTTNPAGEEIPQQVGVIVGGIDLLQICSLVSDYAQIFGSDDDKFPTCDSSSTSNDQIIGVTSGHRSGGEKIEEEKILWFDIGESLCWSAGDFERDMGCSPGHGLTFDWYGAYEYCDNLSYNGSDNWRLPSVVELKEGFQNREILGTAYWSNEYLPKYYNSYYNAANEVYFNLEVYKPFTSSYIAVICRLNE